jgi:diadenosine tetraphosphatase ApaH/serine/threonine PP2A family protein phosphatase
MEGVVETFKQLNLSSKEQIKGMELLKRRSDSRKQFINQKVSVPDDYPVKGVDSSITIEFVKQVLEGYKMNKIIPYAYAKRITEEVVPLLKKDAPFIDIEIPKDGRIIVVGDTHGQLPDLFEILSLGGFPSITNMYLFNGDLVDRGPHGPEVIFAVYAMKVALPNHVFINRGNHEIRRMNEKYDFKNQMLEKYDADLYEAVSESFLWLPFCSLINRKVLVVHGGIPGGTSLKELRGLSTELGKPIPSHKNLETSNQRLVENLLWSDPEPLEKTERTNRGDGVLFSSDTKIRFLKEYKLDVIIRSHQLLEDG